MASDPAVLIALAGSAAAGFALASGAILKGWSQWLELRREQLGSASIAAAAAPGELRALRERVRRLEAIADGTPG